MSHDPTPPRDSSQCRQCDMLKLRVKALESHLTKLQAQLAKAQEGKTGGPEENADYFRKKPTAEEVHRLEIGKILQRHLAANLPLPATVRLEALKLLSEACVIIDDEDLSPAALLAYYVQYVVPDLP